MYVFSISAMSALTVLVAVAKKKNTRSVCKESAIISKANFLTVVNTGDCLDKN